MTEQNNVNDPNAVVFQGSVAECAEILKKELLKNYAEKEAERIVDNACYHAEVTYCKHLYMVFDDWGTIGHMTRMEAVGDTIREIMSHEKEDSPSFKVFNAMYAMYESPIAHLDNFNRGAYGAVTGLFYAAANAMNVEGKYLNHLETSRGGLKEGLTFF